MTAPRLITRSEDLAQLCEALRREPFVTVDTEFMRERTYYPELCVVQLAGEHGVAVVDAQAEGMDLAPARRPPGRPRGGQGVPRRSAGRGNLPAALRRGAGARCSTPRSPPW
jgi:hypothetical protein